MASFDWNDAFQNTLDSIKKYFINLPTLDTSIPGKPLILYIVTQEESSGEKKGGAMLAQNNENGKEKALYYLS